MRSIIDIAIKNNYVLSVAQVAELAKALVSAQQTISGVNTSYLRVVLAGTVQELGSTPRLRAARAALGKIDEETKTRQMAALEAVHSKYYAAILEAVVSEDIKDHPRLNKDERARRALERNRRTNFARSAKSTLASYIKAGFDINGLVVTSVTKRSIYEAVERTKPKKEVTPDQVSAQFEKVAKDIEGCAENLVESDAERAREEISRLVGHLTALLAKVDVKPTDKPAESMHKCIPLQTKAGIFWPAGVETRQ